MSIYINTGQQATGPYEESAVLAWLQSGQISPDALACPHGSTQWQPLRNLFTAPGQSAAFTNVPPAKRFHAFQSLPSAVQDRLLRLQKTDGDFLRMGYGGSALWPFLLAATLSVFFIFLVVNFGSRADSIRVIPLVVNTIIFLIWIGYSGWRVVRQARLPIGNHIYLTPTQLIQTVDGYVRYRELFEVGEIHFLTVRGRGGNRHVLTLRLYDNDSFKFVFTLGMWSSRTAEATMWKNKAAQWRNYAVRALQSRDFAYLESRNTFQGLTEANTPVVQKSSGVWAILLLLLLTFVLIVLASLANSL